MKPHNQSPIGFSTLRATTSKSRKAFTTRLKAFFPITRTRLVALFVFLALMCAAFYSTSSASPLGKLLRAYVSGHASGVKTGLPKAAPTAGRKSFPAPPGKPQQAANQPILGSGDLNIERRGHTATKLTGGRVLIVGGENEGGLVKKSEIFDSGSRQFSLAAKLRVPRAEHTATMLSDGRVLVVGGRGSEGSLASSEIFDPGTELFSRGPSLNLARAGHTATALADGRVLIAGGNAQGSAEIFDPSANTFTLAGSNLGSPRRSHSAVLLKSGKVLIAGGLAEDGSPVQSGEVFDPETMQFSTTKNMRGVRTRPTLRVLPDGKVQVIGGDDDRSMEMFNVEGGYFTAYAHITPDSNSLLQILRAQTRAALIHERLSGNLKLQSFAGSFDELLDRSDHTLTDIPELGEAIVAGGTSSGRALKSVSIMSSSGATVTTDKTDYAPGETVVITGTGWQAGETVGLIIHRDGTDSSTDVLLSTVADASGNISNSEFVIQQSDLGVSFVLTATGETSGYTAQTTFTDGNVKIHSAPAGVTFQVIETLFTNANNCTGAIKSGFPKTETADNNGVNVGVGSGESLQLEAPAVSVQGGAFIAWSSSDPFTVTGGGGRIICVPGFSGQGTRDYTATYAVCTLTCPANQIANTSADGTGNCSTTVNYTAPTTTGTCGTVTCTPPAGSVFAKGTTTVTCTSASTGANCSFTVTVNDNEKPTVSCPANITKSTDPGACSTVATYTATANDNCPGATASCTPASGSTFPKGTTTVTCSATDTSGNTSASSCSFTVTVNDTEKPTITCPANITKSTDPGLCTAVTSFSPTANDNCPGVTTSCAPASGSAFTKGITTVTCTATDTSTNAQSCTFTVTVNDTEKPTISCPANITKSTDPGACSAIATYTTPTPGDNCPGATAACSPASGSTFPKGTNTVTCTATDTSSNTQSCTFTVTVNDTEKPAITCPANITQSTDPGKCDAVVSFSPTATDNCPGVTTSCTPASGTHFAKGATTVNCTATDTSGNTQGCSFTVTVNDTEKPTVSCPSNIITTTAPGTCSAVAMYAATASDNCPGATAGCNPPSGSTFAKGTTTVTCTATDSSSNTSTPCSFTVTVSDNEKPTIACPTNVVQSTDSANCDAVVTYPTPAVSDNCPGVGSPSCTPASGSTFLKGATTVTCNVSDATGNTQSCSFTVTVDDNENPTITCPADITQGNDAGQCSALVNYTTPTGNDNCPGVTVACSPASGSTFPHGTTTVTCTATDTSANTQSCTFTVTVNDTENPKIAACPANITQSTDAGKCDAVVTYTSPAATDNCSGATVACSPASGTAFVKGTTTVTCTATDDSGNTDSCTFTVTVNDKEKPVVTCPSPITQNTDPGKCSAVVSFTSSATDNCDTVTPTCTPASGSTFVKGTTSVSCSATDTSNNTGSCSFTVTVQDKEAPVVTCPAPITQNTDPGKCSAVISFTSSATDNCDSVTPTCTPASGSIFPKGTTTVTCSATDTSSNTASCSFSVTVQDKEAPKVTCPAPITQNTDPGKCSAVVSFTSSATDNCDSVTPTCTPASGSTFPKGTTSVTCSATDTSGNTGSCSFTVTVEDKEAPIVSCPAPIAQNTDPGQCSAVVSYGASATDNCDAVTPICIPASGSTFPKGMTTVSCSATDTSNNTGSCSFTVTVQDKEAPKVTCPAPITQNTDSGDCTAVVTFSATATDNCDIVSPTCTPSSGSIFAKGTTTVTCSATDTSSNTGSCSFTVTVQDKEAPKVTCPADKIVPNDAGTCSAVVNYSGESATDNCDTVSPTCSPASGSTFPKGATTVTCTATDTSGNTGSCSFTVTVEDKEAPKVTCPAPITQDTDPGKCTAVVTFSATVSDNCDTLSPTCTPASGTAFAKGITTVTCTATDDSGNTDSCTFTVTVNDKEKPVVTCPSPITQNTDPGKCSAVVSFTSSATDNCDSVTPTCTPASGSTFVKGTTSVTCSATDTSNNTGSCSFTVTVQDKEAPVVTCPAPITQNTDPGKCSAVVSFTSSATDNCDSVTPTCTPASGSIFPKGTTTVTCSATDTSSNTASCSFSVTVQDKEAPKVTCPAPITQNTDPGKCSAVVSFTSSATDNCDSVTPTCTPASGSTFPKGTTSVTCSATDTSGNTGSCSFTVTVEDKEAPIVSCPAPITQNTDPGQCSAVVSYGASATDNCDTVTPICIPASGSTFPKGMTTVICSATDISSNTGSCSFTVTVQDKEAPKVTCPAPITQNTDSGDCTAVVTFSATATDNCDIVSPTCTPASGSIFAKGTTTVTCSATDTSSNTGSCSFTVTVQDKEAPKVTCPADKIVPNDAGTCSALVNYSGESATDNCDTVSPTCSPASGSTFPKGATTVTCTATDTSGNTGSCSFTVTVEDKEAPKVTCPAPITQDTDPGKCTAVVTFSATVSDNCDTLTPTCTPASGTAFAKGITTVTCTATDDSGNTDSCTFTVTVNDKEKPVVTCPSPITQNTDPGKCSAVVSFTSSATDNCDTVTPTCTPASGSTFAKGTTSVTCSATDTSSNTGSCSFTVTVQDKEAPVVTCPSPITQNTDPGKCSAVVSFTSSATDNCDSVTPTCTPASGSIFPKGTTTVTCSATDTSSNTASCSFSVTVQDKEAPKVTCPAPITQNTDPGKCSAVVSFTSSATDNCDSVTPTCTPASGSTFPKGTTSVTCSATDTSGNTGSCSFTVTVQDKEAPIVSCPAPITQNTDPGKCSALVTFSATASDNCDTVTPTCTPASGTTFAKGMTTVSCSATDTSNNTGSCSFTVTVQDKEAPKVTCPPDKIVPNDAGKCSAVVTFSATATDNCDSVAPTCTPASGSTFPKGATTVTCSATDTSSNAGSCSFSVTVQDKEAPKVTCPADKIVPNDAGTCSAAVNYSGESATDNCDTVAPTCTPASGSTFPKGTTSVTCSATDTSGNTGSCSFTVTVQDKEAPTIACPSPVIQSTDPGKCTAVVTYSAPTASDNCPGVSTSCNPPSGSTFQKGTTTVTCTATDGSSNSKSCSFTVTVNDNEKPTIVSCAQPKSAKAGTGCLAPVPDYRGEVVATDNCGAVTVAQIPAPGTTRPPGQYTITLTITDGSGNSSSCTTTFTVTNDPPIITNVTGPNGPVAMGGATSATVTYTDTAVQGHIAKFSWDDGTADTSVSDSPKSSGSITASHTYAAAGVYTVTVTVTDDCNSTSAPGSATAIYQFIVIYDQNGGFVTGGGWIMSPPGAYPTNPALTGKASFGFVSKYQKGQSIPSGETEFQFQAAGFNFHSTTYDWLVIAGFKAQYKGSGTVNGSGDYGFLLTATDGKLNGGGGIDKFRIKIWNKTGGGVVYDNVLGGSDDVDAANPQALSGGSIVIHK